MEQSQGRLSSLESNDGKVSIDIIRRQEYLLQLKSQVKFPLFEKLKKFAKLSSDEEFRHHTKVRIIEKEAKDKENMEPIVAFIFVFIDKIIFTHDWIEKIDNPTNLTLIPKMSPIIQVIDFSHFCVFKLTANESDPNEMHITFYDQSFSSKSDIVFKFIILKDSYCVHHFIKKYYILRWQKLFEDTILFDFKKLIYNKHFILIKYNIRKKRQERLLLITNALIFNLDHNLAKDQLDFKPKKVKWADPILAIKKVIVNDQKGNELQLLMDRIANTSKSLEYIHNSKYLKYKETRDFEFYSNDERNEFIALIRRNYYDLTSIESEQKVGKYITVEVASSVKEETGNK